jgi:TolB protein
MTRIDEELERRFSALQRRVAQPSTSDLERRRARRARTRRVGTTAAATGTVVVIVAAVVWARVVVGPTTPATGSHPSAPASPYPIIPAHNGVIAFGDGEHLFTIDPTTGQQERVPDVPSGAWLPAWSPDGSQLAVTVFPSDGPRQLWLVRGDGPRLLAEADNVGPPSWSPDGRSIAYVGADAQGSAIHIVTVVSGEDRIVGDVIPPGAHTYFTALFSPDGTQLLFDKGTDSGYAIYVMDVNGSNVRQISAGTSDYNPSWSPDGRSIVFTRQEASMESDIFVMHADGSDVRRLTNGDATETNLSPTWSPDGRLIAYVSGKSGGPGGLVIIHTDGSSPQTLVSDGVLGISWQPVPT